MSSSTRNLEKTVAISPEQYLISFRGAIGAGKTTASQLVCALGESLGITKPVKIAFADPLKLEVLAALILDQFPKEMSKELIDVCRESTPSKRRDDLIRNGNKISIADALNVINAEKLVLRPVLQWWGTEYRRGQDPDYWVKQTVERMTNAFASGHSVVVDDSRFPNEREALKKLGGIEVYIIGQVDTRTTVNGIKGHESEKLLNPNDPDIDLIIHNDSDRSTLQDRLIRLMQYVRSEYAPIAV